MVLFDDLGKISLDSGGYVRLVHGINVNCIDSVCIKINDLIGSIGNPRLLHRLGIVAKTVNDLDKALGEERT